MYSRGTAAEPDFTDGLISAIAAAGALHLDGFHISVALRAAEYARSLGVPVSFDGGAGDRWPRLDELLPLVDWLVVARAFAERETGESDPVAAARSFAHDTVVVVFGYQPPELVSCRAVGFRRISSLGNQKSMFHPHRVDDVLLQVLPKRHPSHFLHNSGQHHVVGIAITE